MARRLRSPPLAGGDRPGGARRRRHLPSGRRCRSYSPTNPARTPHHVDPRINPVATNKEKHHGHPSVRRIDDRRAGDDVERTRARARLACCRRLAGGRLRRRPCPHARRVRRSTRTRHHRDSPAGVRLRLDAAGGAVHPPHQPTPDMGPRASDRHGGDGSRAAGRTPRRPDAPHRRLGVAGRARSRSACG